MSPRRYEGRHRPAHAAVGAKTRRLPLTLTSSFLLPSAAAAALVVTATGASVAAGASPTSALSAIGMNSVAQQTITAQVKEAAAAEEDIADRRVAAAAEAAALQGRQQEAARVARENARVAAAKAAADKAAAEKAAAAKAAADAKKWVMPVNGATFTSGFKMRWGRMHEGNDLAAPTGTPIYAMSQGVVTYTGWYGGGGNATKIRYWDGTEGWYFHQSAILVNVGQEVSPGELVGRVGNTGNSFGAHLHLEIHPNGGAAVDPHPWMAKHGLNY